MSRLIEMLGQASFLVVMALAAILPILYWLLIWVGIPIALFWYLVHH